MIEIKPGYFFCSVNPSPLLRWPINTVQRAISYDGQATYGHTGFFIDANGTTFESGIKIPGQKLFRIGTQDFFKAYAGTRVIIFRHEDLTPEVFKRAFVPLAGYVGRKYPTWRLPLFFAPKLARCLHVTTLGVCSEMAARLACNAKVMRHWRGVYPDFMADLADEKYGRKGWHVVYEGMI